MKHSNLHLIIVASLISFCLCGAQKKSCVRPATGFKDVGEVADYVKCIKTITGSPPYGKRSLPVSSPFLRKIQYVLRNYDPDYVEELLYHIQHNENELEA